MKKYFYTSSQLLVVVCLFLSACNGIFIPDPIDPRIPKYTEEGNNVAGAFVDNNIWKSVIQIGFNYVSDNPHITLWPGNDSLLLCFTGSISGESSSIKFYLKGLNLTKYSDLTTLNGKKIQLDGINNIGYYIENDTPLTDSNKGVGQIYFRNVKNDNSLALIIISGTFSLSVNDTNGKIIKISSGRFDYRISDNSNFQTE